MDTIFDAPMTTHSRGKGFRGGETEQVIAGLTGDLLPYTPLCPHHSNALQRFPTFLRIQKREDLWVGNRPILTNLQAAMALFYRAMRLMSDVAKLVLEREGKCL